MCNCKNKQKPIIDDLVGLELIKKYVIDNEPLSSSNRQTLYFYYDQKYGTNTPSTCVMCWEQFVKEKLREIWTKRNFASLQS